MSDSEMSAEKVACTSAEPSPPVLWHGEHDEGVRNMPAARSDGRRATRSERLTVRLDAGESSLVRRRAAEAHVGVATLARALLLDGIEGSGGTRVERLRDAGDTTDDSSTKLRDELRRVRTELNRVGVNVNQIARKANTDAAALTAPEVAAQLADLQHLMRDVQEIVGGVRWPS